MPRVRRRVHYSGRVQGVGFRFTSQRLAAHFVVSGYVRNLDDGRVELLAEGDGPEVDSFLARVADTLGDYIEAAETRDEPPGDPPLAGFGIRY